MFCAYTCVALLLIMPQTMKTEKEPIVAKKSPLANRLAEVRQQIARACDKAKRDPSEVTLVAVTKTAAPEQMREILQLGVSDLGESRVQVLAQRAVQVNEFHQRQLSRGGEPE